MSKSEEIRYQFISNKIHLIIPKNNGFHAYFVVVVLLMIMMLREEFTKNYYSWQLESGVLLVG